MGVQPAAGADVAANRARIAALGRGLITPLWVVCRRMQRVFPVSAVAGITGGVAGHSPWLAAGLTAALSIAGAIYAWWPLTDPQFRAATELYYDHGQRDGARWRAKTGTTLPRSAAGFEAWLAANPESRGRSTALLTLGRLAEADALIDATTPATAEEAFGIELHRQTSRLYAGGTPDLGALDASWSTLPDPLERLQRRECLAQLAAIVAAQDGRDPIAVLAAARADVTEVGRLSRTPWLLVRWSVLPVVFIAGSAVISATLIDLIRTQASP